jgi:hypothetical protein
MVIFTSDINLSTQAGDVFSLGTFFSLCNQYKIAILFCLTASNRQSAAHNVNQA